MPACGNLTTNGANQASTSPSKCQYPCVGNLNEYCGGIDHLNLYWDGNAVAPAPNLVQSVGEWGLVGCYRQVHTLRFFVRKRGPLTAYCFVNSDSNDARTLSNRTSVGFGDTEKGLTVENCVSACNNGSYSYAGVEWAQECCTCRLFNGAFRVTSLQNAALTGCGHSINPNGKAMDSGNCKVLACSGNCTEYCGANHTMIIYNLPPR